MGHLGKDFLLCSNGHRKKETLAEIFRLCLTLLALGLGSTEVVATTFNASVWLWICVHSAINRLVKLVMFLLDVQLASETTAQREFSYLLSLSAGVLVGRGEDEDVGESTGIRRRGRTPLWSLSLSQLFLCIYYNSCKDKQTIRWTDNMKLWCCCSNYFILH